MRISHCCCTHITAVYAPVYQWVNYIGDGFETPIALVDGKSDVV